MSWNIQDLGINKITGWPGAHVGAYILDTIQVFDPAILVVIEVETAAGGGRNHLVTNTSGGPAIRLLHRALRNFNDGTHEWRVVPPLISGGGGKKEGVGVIFNNLKVNFRGPHQINLDHNGDFYSCDIVAPADHYTGVWRRALPATPPAGGNFNGLARNQNQLAGKTIFQDPNAMLGTTLDFPTPDSRSPFLTEFIEVNVAAPRTFKVFGVHLPPYLAQRNYLMVPADAGKAVKRILKIPELNTPLAANEVRVVLGDFNINLRDPDHVPQITPMATKTIPRAGGGAPAPLIRVSFDDASMVKPVATSTLGGVMPYFDYTSRGSRFDPLTNTWIPKTIGPFSALDFVFAVWGNQTQHPVPGYVVNRVAPWPPNVTRGMQDAVVPTLLNWEDPPHWHPPMLTQTQQFQRLENYGRVRGASDHLPVVVDI